MSFVPLEAVARDLQVERVQLPMLALWYIQLADTVDSRPFVAIVEHDTPVTLVVDDDPIGEEPRSITFEPWPVKFDTIRESTDGSQPVVGITIENINPMISLEINKHGGLRGQPVVMYLSHGGAQAKSFLFEVESAAISQDAITVRLAASSMLDLKMPRQPISRTGCTARFQSGRCGYRGPEEHCPQTFGACSDFGDKEALRGDVRLHPLMFGGRITMPTSRRGIR